ncbi:conserved hypothetical protein [Acidithiobacillus caldus SM-1]|uniref:Uncharacterized protein n=1 Tax=Acidithiobacillus caldus (strain SM-1) TaxID=990288 RepID=F9ZRW6_ACICS|nr:hypothetical protein [Acidithiobacillus caldus]AEK58750.1 conserved hypothetical protein [Acidithiobacillus caldus SM-1]
MHITGRIRPGLKVLKRALAQNAKASNIYNRGLAAGVGFKAIESALEKAGFKGSLVPKNEPFFSVWPKEFKNPQAAERILEVYGEQREGDPVKRLYRFPVVFLHSDPRRMILTRYECYTASGLKYRSEERNGERLCIGKGEIPKRNGRVVRLSTGVPEVVRGTCVPEECPEFQGNLCKRRSHVIVSIPGATNAVEFVEIPTGSFYSVEQLQGTLNDVASVCGGTIPMEVQLGYKGYPIFWMSKVTESVSRVDWETGERSRTKQILARMDAEIEMAHLISLAETAAARIQSMRQRLLPPIVQTSKEVLSLAHEPASRLEDYIPATVKTEGPEPVPSQEPTEPPLRADPQPAEPKSAAQATEIPEPGIDVAAEAPGTTVPELRKQLSGLCNTIGLQPETILRYGNLRFGEGWGRKADSLKKLLEAIHLAMLQDDVDGLIAEIHDTIQEAQNRAS